MSEGNKVEAFLKKVVSENDIVLFMKGTPNFPQCGFSQRVVQILELEDVKYHSVDVLSDLSEYTSAEIREGIKVFSEWPTIPQLYVKGTFVGGCDIITEMYENQELRELLAGLG